jgi:hypothetical protein
MKSTPKEAPLVKSEVPSKATATRETRQKAPQARHWASHWHYLLLALVVLSFALIRFRLRDMPLERDEGEYAYAGQLISQGIAPYQSVYAMKLPGTYAAYACLMAIFGQSPSGIHLGLMVVNAATIFLVFLLGLRLFGRLAGFVAGASYALLSTSESVLGFAAHATHFSVLPALAGTLLLLIAVENGKRMGLYFSSGLLLGLAFLMKQPGIFFVLFGGLYLLKSEAKEPVAWRQLGSKLGMFSLGAAAPFLLTCFVLWRAGVLRKFFFWTFTYASQYASANTVLQALPVLKLVGPGVLGASVYLWILALLGMTAFVWDSGVRKHAWFSVAFLLFSFLAVCPGFFFRQHYFILMLPALALLVGLGVSSASAKFASTAAMRPFAFVPVLAFAAAFAYSVAEQAEFFFQMDPVAACRSVYAPNPFPEAVAIADYINTHSKKNSQIAVLGSEPEIYFYAKRHAATGYIYTYELMERQKYASTMQQEMIREIESAQPDYIVNVDVFFSWFPREGSDQAIFAWAREYLGANYERVGVVEVGRTTEYYWDDGAKTAKPQSSNRIEVFRRKAS